MHELRKRTMIKFRERNRDRKPETSTIYIHLPYQSISHRNRTGSVKILGFAPEDQHPQTLQPGGPAIDQSPASVLWLLWARLVEIAKCAEMWPLKFPSIIWFQWFQWKVCFSLVKFHVWWSNPHVFMVLTSIRSPFCMAFAAVLGQALELGSRAAAGGSRAKRLRSITACAMLRHAPWVQQGFFSTSGGRHTQWLRLTFCTKNQKNRNQAKTETVVI